MCFTRRLILAVALTLVSLSVSARSFIDYGPAPSFLDLEVRGAFGGAMVTENYMGCFPEISQMNTAPGASWSLGIAGVFGIRDWLGLGTQFDLRRNHYRTDLAVSAGDGSSVSNIFLRNSAAYVRIPVYMQFRFNVAANVRWRVDAGLYYAYGISGSQRQDIYNAQVNPLGQLVSTVITSKPGYFGDGSTFIHSFRRSDVGLHLATSLLFGRVAVGGELNLGFKNIAYIPGGRGIVTPNVHNFAYALTLGYRL